MLASLLAVITTVVAGCAPAKKATKEPEKESAKAADCSKGEVFKKGVCVPDTSSASRNPPAKSRRATQSIEQTSDDRGKGKTESTAPNKPDCKDGQLSHNGTCLSTEYERPAETVKIASDELLGKIEKLDIPIYEGTDPPDISGTYRSTKAKTVYDETQGGKLDSPQKVCSSRVTYHKTKQSHRYKVTTEYLSCEGKSSNEEVYISGEDDCFTLYARSSKTNFEGCSGTATSIVSGCLTKQGLEKVLAIGVGKDYRGDSCKSLVANNRLPAQGDIRITADDLYRAVEGQ